MFGPRNAFFIAARADVIAGQESIEDSTFDLLSPKKKTYYSLQTAGKATGQKTL
jgi:hypothetical protein